MARGNEAKNQVIQIIKEAFGANFICEVDKKIYVEAVENGEKVQVAISLTCPKVPVGRPTVNNDLNFEEMGEVASPSVEFTQEERDTLATLMAKIGL
jgi:hypothetical protein